MFNNYGMYPYSSPYAATTNAPAQQMSFVNGIEGAKGYIVSPNTSMLLMDSDSPQFFIKTADRNGMCNIKAYSFQEIPVAANAPTAAATYVTKEEFEQLVSKVDKLFANGGDNSQTKKTLI